MKCSCDAERSFNSEARHFVMKSFGVTTRSFVQRWRSAAVAGAQGLADDSRSDRPCSGPASLEAMDAAEGSWSPSASPGGGTWFR